MKNNLKSLVGFNLKETNGDIGKVEDFYFDDLTWKVRYLVIKTGNWFTGKKVLISPKSLHEADMEKEEFRVTLTKEQIKSSPDIDTEKPVSRHQEEQLYGHYGWGPYWGADPNEHGAGMFGAMPSDLYYNDVDESKRKVLIQDDDQDYHLRSTDSVTGYKIHATDGEIGEVSDYIIDETSWIIKFLVIETGSWLDSREILLPAQWIKKVDWKDSFIVVDVTKAKVKNSPEFNINMVTDESYERSLYDYYGKPGKD